MADLPYHCPVLNGNFFKPPCERQMAEAKEKRKRFPHMLLGFLDKCLECGGKALVKMEDAVSCHTTPFDVTSCHVIAQGEPKLPEKAVEVQESGEMAGFVQEKDDKNAIFRQSILGAIDIFEVKGIYPTRMMLSEHLGIKVYKIELLIKELRTRGEIEIVPDSWPNEVRRPMIISSTANEVAKINMGGECEKEVQNIPEIFQPAPAPNTRLVNIGGGKVEEIPVSPSPDSKDSLHTVDSSTFEILQTDSSDAYKNESEIMTEIMTAQEDQGMAGVVSFKTQKEAEAILGPGKIPVLEIPTCTRSDCAAPGSPVKIDKLGRSMGMCAACVSARGRRGGFALIRAAKTSTSVIAALDGEKYVNLKAWLEAQADEYERTLLQEIIYQLKLALRLAGGEQAALPEPDEKPRRGGHGSQENC